MENDREKNNQKPLPFPVQCPPAQEFFSGFGHKELVIVLISAVFALIILIIIWINMNEALAVTVGFCIIAITFILTRRNIHQESIVDQIKQIYRYHRAQKRFEYEYYDEFGVINDGKANKTNSK